MDKLVMGWINIKLLLWISIIYQNMVLIFFNKMKFRKYGYPLAGWLIKENPTNIG